MSEVEREKIDARSRQCHLTKDDLLRFDDMLSEKFPDLFRYEESRITGRRKVYDTLGEVDRTVRFRRRLPSDDDPAAPPPNAAGMEYLRHKLVPPCITIHVSTLRYIDLRTREHFPDFDPVDFAGYKFSGYADMQGWHFRSDTETKKFVSAVFRMAAKFMTNVYEVYNLKTGKRIRGPDSSFLWCGPEGLDLSRRDPNFYTEIWFNREVGTFCGLKAVPKEK